MSWLSSPGPRITPRPALPMAHCAGDEDTSVRNYRSTFRRDFGRFGLPLSFGRTAEPQLQVPIEFPGTIALADHIHTIAKIRIGATLSPF